MARHKVRFSHEDDTTADEEEEEMSEESSEGEPDCDVVEEEEALPAAPLPPRRSSAENAESAASAATERSGSQEFLDTPLRSLSKKLSSVSAAMVVPTPSTSQPTSPRAPRGSLSQGTRPVTLSDQKAAGWKPGIGSSEGLDMRFLLLDNSGSTRKLDGWILVGDGENKLHGLETDRWCETMSIAVDHAEWNVRHGVRTQLVLLNPPSPKRPLEGRDFVTVDPDLPHHGEQVASVASFLKRNGPCGNTPLTSRLKQLRLRIQSEYAVGATPGATPRGPSGSMPSTPRAGPDTPRAPIRLQKSISPRKMPSITSENSPRMSKMKSGPKVVQRLALTIVTDGLPTSSDSTSSTAQDKDAFVEELQTWEKEFDCKLVIRLTTDGMGAVGYYKRLAEQVDFKVVVLGNLHCEARRARCNGWLAYSPLVHKMREGGATDGGVLGRLHEGRLPLGEAVEVLEWLLRAPGDKPLPRDADGLYHAVEKMLPKLNPVYNGRLRCMTPPIDLRLLRRVLGLGSAARRLRSLTQVLASALCQKGLPA